jgi:hypothetical protein
VIATVSLSGKLKTPHKTSFWRNSASCRLHINSAQIWILEIIRAATTVQYVQILSERLIGRKDEFSYTTPPRRSVFSEGFDLIDPSTLSSFNSFLSVVFKMWAVESRFNGNVNRTHLMGLPVVFERVVKEGFPAFSTDFPPDRFVDSAISAL